MMLTYEYTFELALQYGPGGNKKSRFGTEVSQDTTIPDQRLFSHLSLQGFTNTTQTVATASYFHKYVHLYSIQYKRYINNSHFTEV